MIVVINKMDTCDWSEERFKYIKENLYTFLVKNCGFESHRIFWVCVEGLTGMNLKEKVNIPEAEWY